eukprot:TRINITY_DN15271_c0_g1_i1.p1 TRINITY_DN15271_c0_g1~~TRINITY_DN15271_c0_g1_i1.p1  ORF type:complete len:596 (-),score=127.26 TRINITY_DN15271_c0_g1_i1:25-1812(-)
MSKMNSAATRRKLRAAQASPIGREVPTESVTQEKKTLVDKVSSSSFEERNWAIGSLSRLVLEDPTAFALVSKDPKCITQLVRSLVDSEVEIRLSASGLLRNLTNIGDENVCNLLIEKDCLSSCCELIKRTTASAQTPNQDADSKETVEDEFRVLVNIFALLGNLCEVSSYPMQRVAREGILPTIISWLKPNIGTQQTAIFAAELLNILTEEFEPIKSQITDEHLLLFKVTLANQKHTLRLRATVASVVVNICPLKAIVPLLPVILPTLSQCLEWEPSNTFLSIDNLLKAEPQLFEWDRRTNAQVMALEVLGNIMAGEENAEGEDVLPKDVVNLIIQSSLCDKVLPLCSFPRGEVYTYIQEAVARTRINPDEPNGEDVTTAHSVDATSLLYYERQLRVVQGRALSCLGNIIYALPSDGLGNIGNLWNLLFSICQTSASDPSRENAILVILTSTMFSFLRETLLEPTQEQTIAIFSLLAHPEEQVRANALGMAGCIARTNSGPAISLELGKAVLKGLEDPSGWVIVEACEVLFSVFDDNFNDVVKSLNLLGKLKEFGAYLQQKMPALSNDQEPELQGKLEEILENINPFLEYKRQQN